MGSIRRPLRYCRTLASEYLRSKIIDAAVEQVVQLGFLKYFALPVWAMTSYLASLQHDPALAIVLGLAATLLFILVLLAAIRLWKFISGSESRIEAVQPPNIVSPAAELRPNASI